MGLKRSFCIAAAMLQAISQVTSHSVPVSDEQIDQFIHDNAKEHRMLYRDVHAYFDPSDIEYKPHHSINFPVAHTGDKKGYARPLNILALGGFATWGSQLDDSYKAYPWLIGHPFHQHVDNISYRPTGAEYPSMCLETLSVREDNRHSYDMILLDFPKNGMDGFPLLLKRLRDRHPDALIIYVGIWSLLNSIVLNDGSGKMPLDFPQRDADMGWEWRGGNFYDQGMLASEDCRHEVCSLDALNDLMESYGAFVYEFPRPQSPQTCMEEGWFSDDWHHLSEVGHQILANDLIRFLNGKENLLFRRKEMGTWGLGDECYNWAMNGNNMLPTQGAKMRDILEDAATDRHRYVLEFKPDEEGSIEFSSKFDVDVPLGIGYLSRQYPAEFSVVEIQVNDNEPIVIDPSENNAQFFKSSTITAYSHIGVAKPGYNKLTVRTKEERKDAFQAVGIYMCGSCAEDGHLGTGAVNFDFLNQKSSLP